MNKRIKQLAEQAGANYYSLGNRFEKFNEHKFAELIVGECCKILADNSEFRGCVIIGKHFGVEE